MILFEVLKMTKKRKVTVSFDDKVWKDYQVYCFKSNPRKIPSYELEKYMRYKLKRNGS